MIPSDLIHLNQYLDWKYNPNDNRGFTLKAARLFNSAKSKGQFVRISKFLTRRKKKSIDIDWVEDQPFIDWDFSVQKKITVPIDRIHGWQNKKKGFDDDFYPINSSVKFRWIRIASDILQGRPFPPVMLMQTGDNYIVRYDHFYISVAHALKQKYLEAHAMRIEESIPIFIENASFGSNYLPDTSQNECLY